uniref:Uncharacterized protein n=1 Tax=Arundo donax TaxID=35708 RepID=A0A0A9GBX7_ARUDO
MTQSEYWQYYVHTWNLGWGN